MSTPDTNLFVHMNPASDTKKNAQRLSRCFGSLFGKPGAVAHFTDIISETFDVNEILTAKANEMHRSDRSTEKQAEIENEAHGVPKAKKCRSDNRVSKMATIDNDTMVKVFKCLNYCQLARNSLVSKRFWNLIRTQRHKLARLDVKYIYMITMEHAINVSDDIKIFDKKLSPEAYNKWVIRNHYSKQVPLEDQVAGMQSARYEGESYELSAVVVNKDSNCLHDTQIVFDAGVVLNHENWPVFQHFVRLITDPFVYIRLVELIPQFEVLNLLAGAINLDHNRLQCNVLVATMLDDMQKFIKWIKDHIICDKFRFYDGSNSNCDEELLDFFLTGANCTTKIVIESYDLSKVVVNFVQKFMDLKNCVENQLVESICGDVSYGNVEGMKRNFATFIVKEERNEDDDSIEQVFEFTNNAIGKKLQLTIRIILRYRQSEIFLKIANL